VSDFFEPPLRLEDESESDQDWEGPPTAVVPVSIPIEQVVAQNEAMAVYLASISAYPSGFEFDVFVLVADRSSELSPFDPEYRMLAQHTGEIPSEQLRIGFLFADGSKATNTGEYFNWYEESGAKPDAPVMSGVGGRGGEDGRWHSAFWVWPLPPPGKLELLCEWPEAGLPLTRHEIDPQPILEAAARAHVVFPPER
jgi:hypothetical protein